jgi:hypothetical protein
MLNAHPVRTVRGSRTPSVDVTLDRGLTLQVRPIRPSDNEDLRRAPQTCRHRRRRVPGRGIVTRWCACSARLRGNGIDRFSSLVLWENIPMRRLLTRLGARFSVEGGGVLHIAPTSDSAPLDRRRERPGGSWFGLTVCRPHRARYPRMFCIVRRSDLWWPEGTRPRATTTTLHLRVYHSLVVYARVLTDQTPKKAK